MIRRMKYSWPLRRLSPKLRAYPTCGSSRPVAGWPSHSHGVSQGPRSNIA